MNGTWPGKTRQTYRKECTGGLYSSGFTQRPDLTVMGAFSGLEIACWDMVGKALERPVWALLGGRVADRVRAYSYIYPMDHHDEATFFRRPGCPWGGGGGDGG